MNNYTVGNNMAQTLRVRIISVNQIFYRTELPYSQEWHLIPKITVRNFL